MENLQPFVILSLDICHLANYNVVKMSYNDNHIGKIVKQKRTLISLTLFELGKTAGVSPSHLGKIERGERFPSARVLRKIAKPLGFNENELFMIAGFLSEQYSNEVEMADTQYQYEGLDPLVAQILAKESIEVQRDIIGILSILKILARSVTNNHVHQVIANKAIMQSSVDTSERSFFCNIKKSNLDTSQ